MPRLSKIGAAALGAFGWTTGASAISASYLVVAGGGSGGQASNGTNLTAGGGGAGGYLTGTTSLSLTTTYTVTVGAGGASVTGTGATNANGNNGSNSQFGTLTASVGGGAGGSGANASNGGSGGGAGYNFTAGTSTSGQGNNGGSSATFGSGGGGGAGSAGSAGTSGASGAGGNGSTASAALGSGTYAGGGGGGASFTPTAGAGGTGGGGAGGSYLGNGTNATANTGGGGGGSGAGNSANTVSSGSGGSGVVIISYLGAQQFGGGVVTSSGGYTIHTFNTSGTLAPLSSLTASYLIVAGGGSSGYDLAGGGGAGGLLSGSSLTIDTNSTYLITVGAGAAGVTSGSGNSGSSSAFSMVSTTAVGGGGGSRYATNGVAGASGGGAGGDNASGGPFTGGSATPAGQGSAGGGSNVGSPSGGGGGGGKGAVGGTGTTSTGGAGGVGSLSSISGTSTYYAGGGGGGGYTPNSISAGAGGLGGGGAGGATTNQVGTAGTANTGGGGGGTAGGGGASTSAAGGSGIVIISYAGATQQMAGGTVTISGGNVIHTFTSSGYLTPLKYVGNSLRIRKSATAYLSRTPSVAGNRNIWTVSFWAKRGILGSPSQSWYSAGTGANIDSITLNSSDKISIDLNNTTVLTTTQVFRDPSAWYHIVFAVDTSQATASNRAKLYINGSLITAFDTDSRSSITNNLPVTNTTVLHKYGYYDASILYADVYYAENNLIDGQQLTPNSFGTFNSYGVWQPITYGGSYGTCGSYLPFTVDKTQYSYAFNTTPSYLTSSTAGLMPLGNTTWSIECWVWCNVVPTSNVAFIANTASGGIQIFYRPSINTVEVGAYGVSDVFPATTTINNLLLNAWNHFVFTSNGTQLRIFANGILIGYLSSSYAFAASQGTVYIGTNLATAASTLDGFISNLRVCNGSIPTSYQTTSTTINASIFTPPTTALTTTSQGAANVSLLTCQSSTIVDNSSSPKTLAMTGTVTPSNIGCSSNPFYDRSPVGNNWTPNNISLINGSTCDSMTDVPTLTSATVANYCVLNPLTTGSYTTLSGANLNTYGNTSSNNGNSRSSFAMLTGKWYIEVTLTANPVGTTYPQFGIITTVDGNRPNNGAPQSGYSSGMINPTQSVAYFADGTKQINSSATSYGNSYTNGDVIGIAIDSDNGAIYFSKNGVFQNSGVPTSGATKTGAALTWTGGTVEHFFSIADYNGTSTAVNFGQRPFTYTPPTGFVALNTYNLPTSTIVKGNTVMDATLYTGNGTSQSITNAAGYKPDLVWTKSRSNANNHGLLDSVRGVSRWIGSNSTSAEDYSVGSYVTAFNSNGFSVGTGGVSNENGQTYVGWQWQAGGTAVTNTSGSISSQVSANTTSGFSVATYTGTGANATIGHGLGVAPQMVIVKTRSLSGENWNCWHTSLGGNTYRILLNTAGAVDTGSPSIWSSGGINPTSTTFTVGTSTGTNGSASTYVAYCWAPIAGYSAFGSYTGNGSTDGPFIYLGFRPRWIMIKNSSAAGNGWITMDSSRDTYNQTTYTLYPSSSSAETNNTTYSIDILSNGFKVRASDPALNGSTNTLIYACFAENPFKYSNAR